MDDAPLLGSFAAAQNLPPPLPPLLPLGGGLTSGCLVTTVIAWRVECVGFASALCGAYVICFSSSLDTM